MLFPNQGHWTEKQYLALDTNHLIEFRDGCLEMLPMPTLLHQLIARFLFTRLTSFVASHAEGEVLFAPLPIRPRPGLRREPDILYLRPERIPKNLRSYPEGADLVVEVVSEGAENRRRDLEEKPLDYAAAGIPEYWIVDPEQGTIRVLVLDGDKYRVHGEFGRGQTADSVLLAGFAVKVDEVLPPDGSAPAA
jgi:Uma2 family endonuclease